MTIRKKKYVTGMLVLAVFFLAVWALYPSRSTESAVVEAMADFVAVTDAAAEDGYDDYLNRHANAERPGETIRIEGEHYAELDGDGFEVADGYEGLKGRAVLTPESGTISWNVRVGKPGLYNVRIHYYPMEGKSSAIEREFRIDREVPFEGADLLLFDRIWDNLHDEIRRDNRGNDLRPRQVEKPSWQLAPFADGEGRYDEPYSFYFESGDQVVSLTALREPMAIDYIELYQEPELKSYDELKREYEANGIAPVKDQYLVIQAEDAVRKSSPTLYPVSDRSSPTVVPYHVSKIRVNTIGGLNWKLPGQWIEWEFEVEEDGLYQIALKRKQDQLRGVYATRNITIDGQYPFREMKRMRFNFDMDWKVDVLGGEEPYLFHLTKGKHRLRMTVSLGELAPLIRTIESSVLQLNEMYRKILMITSNAPDPYRDYQLDKRIPDMIDVFREQAETIQSVADYLEQSTGERSDKVAVLHTMVRQLNEMAAKPETVAGRLNAFKVNVGGLGTWILTVREQPLTLDYLVVSSPDRELPRAEATLFEEVKHELGAYIASYTEDYDSIGSTEEKGRSVTVWVTTGRDQAQVLKALIDDTFTPESNISVHLRLVPGNILLPATLAGEGPDVALQIGEDVPVNFAMRSAAADLTAFPDYEEVASRFRDSALVPYKYNGGVYALPEQQTFPMLFYRKDILEELELAPPKTWQDIYNMISVLQKHNMEFFLPLESSANNVTLVPNATFAMLLYQNGGEFYRDGGKRSALDSEVSMDVFKRWTQFYTNYKFPLQADFPNRFRTGEMPIGIADYTTYNMLTVLAPEIKGLWDFTVVPGTVREDGSVSHEVASHTTAVMMLENADDKEAAWAFMKWWTDKDTQIAYGREMEGLMGEAARYPTANIEALAELPWPVKDYTNLESQWQWVRGIPQVPGGYFTGRHLDNAFRRVVNGNENPREALSDYILYIDDEIEIKRKEFNLLNEPGG
ncbi:ABC transporter substrate-binding protein [Paenibacillus cisolokensis]|uniref:ABC transporter substrate-binding protein n=2 Tax=Paenibacillus cisolokensis TaxID=1658519 RepID=A0ABQ4N9D1_9BACL|nr:extracellular solute-binding protein [Paenibacillus cisolokensis]GIQ64516.1 ABC transporter substrate-binding protein [Paenibacillus cisolokensis]